MARVMDANEPGRRIAHELSQGILLLALSGGCFGGLVGMVAIATKALGR